MKFFLLKIIVFFIINFNLLVAKEVEFLKSNNNSLSYVEDLDAKAYILGDKSGDIFLSSNEEKKYPLASLTKIMTLLITFDAINLGYIRENDVIEMDKESNSLRGSRINIKTGTKIAIKDLIKATAIYSANNAAYALAKYIGEGNVEEFVKMMNRKAEILDLENELEYHTPTGLPPYMTGKKVDLGTPKGVYELSKEALKYSNYIEIASQKNADILNGKIKFKNRNKLLGEEGIYGIKTGHHDLVGYNISIASKKDNMNIIYVVIGSPDETTRDKKVKEDINKFYNKFNYKELLNKEIPIKVLKVTGGVEKYLEAYPDKDINKIYDRTEKIKLSLKIKETLKAPIKKGDKIGSFKLYVGEKEKIEGKVISKSSIDKIK